jgi:hypothetical protein
MASSFTTNKVLEKPGNGDYVDTWNVPVNGDMDIIDQAFGGVTSLNATGGSATLTSTQYRSLVLSISGAMSASVTYTIPSGKGGQWIVYNNTTDASGGPWSVTIASGGGGTSYTVTRGQRVLVYSDGTNVSVVYAFPTETLIPSGLITLWSGSIASIPTGWYLCNGSNGTPDLRDRFIVGAGSTYAVAATGGSANAVLVSHTHTATVTDPGHTHSITTPVATNGYGGTNSSFQAYWFQTQTGATGSATTGISVANSTEGVSGTNANLPPYYALAYIMKA